jgi:type IV pilus assembly protein PilA
LAAIAIPAYQDYTIRAKVSEGILGATTAKIAVSDAWTADGVTGVAALAADWLANVEATTASKYVGKVSVDGTGFITVHYGAGVGVPTQIQAKRLVYTPSVNGKALAAGAVGSIEWSCKSATSATAGARGLFTAGVADLPARYAPSECK